MKIAKNISLGIWMQVLVLLMHILIHSIMYVMDGSFDDIQIACSFVAVILITYLAVLCFDLPVYVIFCGAVITFLFVLIFENEGVYLLYYLHSGSSQFFNPDVFTDAGELSGWRSLRPAQKRNSPANTRLINPKK